MVEPRPTKQLLLRLQTQAAGTLPLTGKCQPLVLPSHCSHAGARVGLYITCLQNCLLRSVANALVFRAFGNSAGLLLFACTAAFKTVCAIVVFSTAFTSRAGGVVINSRFLGHVTSPLLELCYKLSLAPHQPGHKRVHYHIS